MQVFVPLLYLYIGPELLHFRKSQRINLNMSEVLGRYYKNNVHETREQMFRRRRKMKTRMIRRRSCKKYSMGSRLEKHEKEK